VGALEIGLIATGSVVAYFLIGIAIARVWAYVVKATTLCRRLDLSERGLIALLWPFALMVAATWGLGRLAGGE